MEATLAATRSAPVVPARPSLLQESHIRTAADRRAKGVAWSPWLAFSFHVPQPLDRDAFERTMQHFVTRHGALLSWFEPDSDRIDDRTTFTRRALPADQVELELVGAGTAPDTDAARAAVAERFAAGTSPLAWPSFAAGAIDHGADGFTVYYGVDHSFTDGVSLTLGVDDIFRIYQLEAHGEGTEPQEVGSYVDFSEQERALSERLTWRTPAVRVWARALLSVRNKMPSTPLDIGLEPGGTAPSTRTNRTLADAATMQAFEQRCKAHGGGASAGLFGILALIDVALTGRPAYLALNTIATRSESKYAMAQGWFINLVPIAFRVPKGATFDDLVGRAQKSMKRSKAATDVPARAIVDYAAKFGGVKVGATAVPPMVSYLDMRRLPGAELPGVDDIHALGGPGTTGDVSLWINRRTDRTYALMSYPDNPRAAASIDHYFRAITELIRAVAAGEPVDVETARAAMELTGPEKA
ncbi:MAG TPA: condensation domain-containing protein [Flexivirga sp.]|uniref:condensation domain-containing protein n=1 Tax=Flexivirga sp. TaxID=1962927 RepID=UPI002BEDC190|nr:condensation domain-containing protein [Flexivirga sp.]HWC22132.1 condensation domain-containing protein [Flexivirga sp.]